jgi:F-type H+-transporting ATPase subunit b
MLIDWFTVIAQIINFLVLVVLLKRFLFDKITKAMDEREKRIASALKDADNTREIAEEEVERYRRMNQELEDNRNRILAEVKDEALSIRQKLIENARSEVEDVKTLWCESVEREKNSFLVELRGLIGKEAVSVVRSALSDLANVELEQRIVDVFAEQFSNMSEEKILEIRNIFQTTAREIKVDTAFDLSDDQKKAIEGLLQRRIAKDLPVGFERSENNVCGIELRFQGYRIGWSIESYLKGFEKAISRTLESLTERSILKSG